MFETLRSITEVRQHLTMQRIMRLRILRTEHIICQKLQSYAQLTNPGRDARY